MLKGLFFIIVTSIFVAPVFAEPPKFYVGSSLMASGFKDEDDGVTYEVNAGYSLSKYFAIEFDYIELGGDEVNESCCLDTSGIALMAVAKYPINDFSLYAKVGNFWWEQEGTVNAWWLQPSVDLALKENSSSVIWGVGVDYNIFSSLSLKLELKETEIKNDSTAMLSVGLNYYF
ncbi:outer membrane beta-barrel protein [Colwelliaceae bacterium 6471]